MTDDTRTDHDTRPLNRYEQKQADRRERYEDRAVATRREAQSVHDRAHTMASAIPFGQPILVGHHSEGRDRRYRARIHSTFGKAFELNDKAQHYAAKAAGVGAGGISSDDEDAVTKLREKLAGMEASQTRMKQANAAIRKHAKAGEAAQVAALVEQDMSEAEALAVIKPDFCGRVGFPSYALSNNNGNMRRVVQRIAELERESKATDVETQGVGYVYREDVTENRVMFLFEGKPSEDVRRVLKGSAFKWSPSRGAWVRQLNNAGRWAAKHVRGKLDAMASAHA